MSASAATLESLGLSRREAESLPRTRSGVLFWVAQGKTNPEVALILGLSPRTVQKNPESSSGQALERIYQKLEVLALIKGQVP